MTEELDHQGLWFLCLLPRPTMMREAVCILSPAPWLAGNPRDIVGQVREMSWGEWGVGCGCWSVFPGSSSFPVCIHGAAGLRGREQCCPGGWRASRALSLLPWPLWSLCALVLPADNPRLEFHLWVSPAVWHLPVIYKLCEPSSSQLMNGRPAAQGHCDSDQTTQVTGWSPALARRES